jgi:hypothetical protein
MIFSENRCALFRIMLWSHRLRVLRRSGSTGSAKRAGPGAQAPCLDRTEQEDDMPDSAYKVIELIGTSGVSWEKAAANALEPSRRAGQAELARRWEILSPPGYFAPRPSFLL